MYLFIYFFERLPNILYVRNYKSTYYYDDYGSCDSHLT